MALSQIESFYISLDFQLEVYDSGDSKVYSSSSSAQDSSVSFAYKIPQDISGGEYTIKVFNTQMPTASSVIKIRSYNRQSLVVSAAFDQESYFAGELVSGNLSISLPDGGELQSSPTFSFVVNFGIESTEVSDQIASIDGIGSFQFVVPENST